MQDNLNKIFTVAVLALLTLDLFFIYKYKRASAENRTLQEAIKNPAKTDRGKITYRTVTLLRNTTSFINLTEDEKRQIASRYEQELKNKDELVESLYGSLLQYQELDIDLGHVSCPVVPAPPAPTNGVKNWTAVFETKPLDNTFNIGLGRRIYRDFTVGASLNNNAKFGIIGLIRF